MMPFDLDMRRDLYLHVHVVTLLRVLLRDGWPNDPQKVPWKLRWLSDRRVQTCIISVSPSSAWHAGPRGQPRRLSAAVRELSIAPIREHSRKPDEAYPRIELFARGTALGWDSFGDEIGVR